MKTIATVEELGDPDWLTWEWIEGLAQSGSDNPYQQAAVRVAAEVIAPHAYDKVLWRCTLADGRSMEQTALDAEDTAQAALSAAAPHLRAGMADEILDDTPGSPLTRGYQRLMDPKPGEHPVRTWEAAVRVMLDTLLEGGAE